MRAMILAAGRGERLRPLTDTVPKPLLTAGGQPLVFHHLEALARSGFREVVINIAHLGEQIRSAVGDGSRWGLNISYSQEPEGALETGGGIHRALPELGSTPFLVINADVWCDLDPGRLRAVKCDYAHLVLVPVPAWKDSGDFCLDHGRISNSGEPSYTFSGIALYHPRFFANCESGRWSVVPLLRQTVDTQLVTGEVHHGAWSDPGTLARLQALRDRFGN
jgi:MurNAc alpha-1-phosphate uridylyltransferase